MHVVCVCVCMCVYVIPSVALTLLSLVTFLYRLDLLPLLLVGGDSH